MFDCDKIKNEKKSRRYLYDLYLLAAIILPTFCWIIISNYINKAGEVCVIQYENSEAHSECLFDINNNYGQYLIFYYDEEKNCYCLSDFFSDLDSVYNQIGVEIVKYDYNIIYFSSDGINVVDANCNDKTCVNTHSANRNGDMIICLPHKLTISVSKKLKDNEYDAVTW